MDIAKLEQEAKDQIQKKMEDAIRNVLTDSLCRVERCRQDLKKAEQDHKNLAAEIQADRFDFTNYEMRRGGR